MLDLCVWTFECICVIAPILCADRESCHSLKSFLSVKLEMIKVAFQVWTHLNTVLRLWQYLYVVI